MRLVAATRGSSLALWQTRHVADLVASLDPDVEVEPLVVSTSGDRRLDVPIHAMGGKGVFVKEVQAAVLDGRADIAVHSAKDLPAVTVPGLTLAAVPPRADPRDALVGSALSALPGGARVATGSVRRRAQLAWLRPDLTFAELRGNIETRLARAGDHDAVVMAAAALDRLGLDPGVVDRLDVDEFVPQVGQGALAVECRADADPELLALLAGVDDPTTRRAVDAERSFLAELGGDCDLPAGAHARTVGDEIVLTAMLASLDGHVLVRETRRHDDPEDLGRGIARFLLDEAGGADLLADRTVKRR